MARPVSWLPRLHEIRKTVASSVRSHYGRKEIQALFKLQPRAASSLLELLPRVEMWGAVAVERDVLARFLDKVHKAENVSDVLVEAKATKQQTSHKRPRALVRRDQDVVYAASLGKWLTRGHLHIDFATAQELFDALWRVASVLQEDLEEFVQLYEPAEAGKAEPDQDRAGIAALFEELDQMENKHHRRQSAYL